MCSVHEFCQPSLQDELAGMDRWEVNISLHKLVHLSLPFSATSRDHRSGGPGNSNKFDLSHLIRCTMGRSNKTCFQ